MRVAKRGGEFVSRLIKLLEGRVDVFGFADASGCEQTAPMPGEFVEHIDPDGRAEITAHFVDAEIGEPKPPARTQFPGAMQEDRFPVCKPSSAELLALGGSRADGLNMVFDHARARANPMHGGG